jgi:hypothetical protein
MQSQCRNFGTPRSTALRPFQMLEPKSLQKVAGHHGGALKRHHSDICCQIDTKCRFVAGGNRTLSGAWLLKVLGRVSCGRVNQHDWNVVLNGVNAAALAAFQALPVGVQNHRLFANRTDQHIEQILRNHRGFIVRQVNKERGNFVSRSIFALASRILPPRHRGPL